MELLPSLVPWAIWFFAGFVSGLTSFGGTLLAVPLLILIWPAQKAIVAGCVVGGFMAIYLVFLYHRFLRRQELLSLFLGLAPAVPLGVIVLNHASSRLLLFGLGLVLCLFLFWQILGRRVFSPQKRLSQIAALPFGALSGFLQGATGMLGAPIGIYAFLRHWGKEETVANLNLVAVGGLAVWLAAQLAFGYYRNIPPFYDLLADAFFACLGIRASVPVLGRINVQGFRRLMIVMIAFAALACFARALLGGR